MINAFLQRSRALWLRRNWRRPLLLSTILVSLGLLVLGLVRGWRDLMERPSRGHRDAPTRAQPGACDAHAPRGHSNPPAHRSHAWRAG